MAVQHAHRAPAGVFCSPLRSSRTYVRLQTMMEDKETGYLLSAVNCLFMSQVLRRCVCAMHWSWQTDI